MPAKFLFRDPDTIPHHRHGGEMNLAQVGAWTLQERERMNQAFVAAMVAAGHNITAPSTHPGTIRPVANYQRSD
jgi:hypothetical protein